MLDKEGRKVSINVGKSLKDGHLALVAQEMNFESVDDLIAAVGYAHLTPRRVLNRLYGVLHPDEPGPGRVRRAQRQGEQGRSLPARRRAWAFPGWTAC